MTIVKVVIYMCGTVEWNKKNKVPEIVSSNLYVVVGKKAPVHSYLSSVSTNDSP